MTNFVLTAGTSISSNILAGKGIDQGGTSLADQVRNALAEPDDRRHVTELGRYVDRVGLVGGVTGDGLSRSADPLGDIEQAVVGLDREIRLASRWQRRTVCAEGSALWAWAKKSGRAAGDDLAGVLDGEDTVHLLASDTDAGIGSAALVGWLLAEQVELLRVTDHGSERLSTIDGRGPAGCAQIRVIDGLTAKDATSFKTSMAPLGRALGEVVGVGQLNVVLLSGGFKAVPPHVIACCEFLNDGRGVEIEVGINFEDTEELLELPLRKVPGDWPQVLASPMDYPTHLLAGWAYTSGGELTGFGEMLARIAPGHVSAAS